MDERFTAAALAQPLPKAIALCRADIHPPLYFIALWAWNRAGLALLGGGKPHGQIVSYRLPAIGAEGMFVIQMDDGEERNVPGLYPEDWPDWPLAPLWFLRIPSVLFSLVSAVLLYALARRLWPGVRGVALTASFIFLFTPFGLTWDTVMRSYSMQTTLLLALALSTLSDREGSPAWRDWIVLAALTAACLLTGYIAMFALPCLLAAMWPAQRGAERRISILCGVLFGCLLAAMLWGRAFLSQSGLPPNTPAYDVPESNALVDQILRMFDVLWHTLFSYGVVALLNPYPSMPAYIVAYILYVACLFSAGRQAFSARVWGDKAAFLLAFGPLILIAVVNAIRPETTPIHARYFSLFAPYFFLVIARGFVALTGIVIARRERGA